MVSAARSRESHIRQGSSTVMLKQWLQKRVRVFKSVKAAAKASEYSSGARSRKKVRRDAVLGPTPGKREKASIKRVTGSGIALLTISAQVSPAPTGPS